MRVLSEAARSSQKGSLVQTRAVFTDLARNNTLGDSPVLARARELVDMGQRLAA
jgi:hypothetical protein